MAALDFPSSPLVNDTYTANGRTFEWNGEAWLPVSSTFINDGSFVFYDGPLNVGIGTQTPSTKFEVNGTITATAIDVTSPTGITVNGNNVWHSGNDGASSGLDADLIDGLESAQFLRSDIADTMSQGTVATSTLTVENTNGAGTGTATGAVIAEFVGDTDSIVIQNIGAGDYGIYNPQQNNGIEIYDGTAGVVLLFNGDDRLIADGDGLKTPSNMTIGSAAAPNVTLNVDGTDAVQLTVGTTAQRPTGAAGMIRYNSTLGIFEGYTTEWGEISGGIETQDDGVQVLDNSPTLNFTGNGVTVTDGGSGVTNINIPDSGVSSTTDVPEGSNLYFTNERVDDRVAALLVEGTNITLTYDDIGGTITIDAASGSGFDLSNNDLTDVGDVSAAGLVDGGVLIYDTGTSTWRTFALSGDITMTDGGIVTIGNNAVALGSNTTGNYIATIAGTANEIEVSGSGSETAAVTVGLPNNVTVSNNLTVGGDLIVNGTTTTVNSNTVNIGDNIIVLNADETGTPSQDGGIEIERGTSANVSFFWDESADVWSTGGQSLQASTFIGSVTGDITGNADTATALETARTIALSGDLGGSASFDGTTNITINATIQPLSVETSMIANDAVTFAKVENVAAERILGRQGTSGNIQELTPLQAREVAIAQRQVYVQETPPGAPNAGDLWFDSDDASLYLYYQDVDTSQWVGISGPAGGGGSGTSPFVDTGTFVYYGGPRNVGIGTATPGEALEVVGNILATQDVIAYSDERLKKNIETINGAVNTIRQLRGVSYRRKSDMTRAVGLIAQEVQEVLPEVVRETDDGFLAVAYGNIVGVLVEATKEQQATIDSQEERIARLEEMVAKLMEK